MRILFIVVISIIVLIAIFSLGTSQNWSINIKAEINLWNSNNIATDYENYLGGVESWGAQRA